ncbi:MAG: hypothetical protein AB7L66_10435 [Gemmatimonadales bacterium]
MRAWSCVVAMATVASQACQSPTNPTEASPAADFHRGRPGAPARPLGVYGSDGEGRRGCRGPDDRAFDFWVGSWTVTNARGLPPEVSEITRGPGRCMIFEKYNGGRGRSISRFDRVAGRWVQDYVDNTGLTLRLDGTRTGDVMHLTDTVRAIPNGPALASQFDWTANPDGTVHQLWLLSLDGGASFLKNADLVYHPTTDVLPPEPPAPTVCAERPAYRALDALVGRWRVRDSRGRRIGVTTVELTAGQCLLEERFVGDDGYRLTAFTYLDRFVGRWYRAQADSYGNTFRLGGAFDGSVLPLAGPAPGRQGGVVPVRMTWQLADGPVQRWEAQGSDGNWGDVATFHWEPIR